MKKTLYSLKRNQLKDANIGSYLATIPFPYVRRKVWNFNLQMKNQMYVTQTKPEEKFGRTNHMTIFFEKFRFKFMANLQGGAMKQTSSVLGSYNSGPDGSSAGSKLKIS